MCFDNFELYIKIPDKVVFFKFFQKHFQLNLVYHIILIHVFLIKGISVIYLNKYPNNGLYILIEWTPAYTVIIKGIWILQTNSLEIQIHVQETLQSTATLQGTCTGTGTNQCVLYCCTITVFVASLHSAKKIMQLYWLNLGDVKSMWLPVLKNGVAGMNFNAARG